MLIKLEKEQVGEGWEKLWVQKVAPALPSVTAKTDGAPSLARCSLSTAQAAVTKADGPHLYGSSFLWRDADSKQMNMCWVGMDAVRKI